MSLINCVECGKEISSEALNCPSCGRSIKEVVVTTQSTSKIWKVVKLLSWFGIIIAIVMYGNKAKDGANILLFFSIIGLVIGKLGSWWTNK